MSSSRALCVIDLAARQLQTGLLNEIGLSPSEIVEAMKPAWGELAPGDIKDDIRGFRRSRTVGDIYNRDAIQRVLDLQEAVCLSAFRRCMLPSDKLGNHETYSALYNAATRANQALAQMRSLTSNGGTQQGSAPERQTFDAFMEDLRAVKGQIGLATPTDAQFLDIQYPEIAEGEEQVAATDTHAPGEPVDPDEPLAPTPADLESDPIAGMLARAREVRPNLDEAKARQTIAQSTKPKPWTSSGARKLSPRQIAKKRQQKAASMRRYRSNVKARKLNSTNTNTTGEQPTA